MRTCFLFVITLALSFPLAGAAPKRDSFISAFAGRHIGSVDFAYYYGSAIGNFKAPKKRESGSVTLQSVAVGNGSVGVTEQFNFNKNSVTWSYYKVASGGDTVYTGTGTATIQKNVITYRIPFQYQEIPYILVGSMRLAKNHSLVIQEILSTGGVSTPFTYRLDGERPEK